MNELLAHYKWIQYKFFASSIVDANPLQMSLSLLPQSDIAIIANKRRKKKYQQNRKWNLHWNDILRWEINRYKSYGTMPKN